MIAGICQREEVSYALCDPEVDAHLSCGSACQMLDNFCAFFAIDADLVPFVLLEGLAKEWTSAQPHVLCC